MSFTIIEELINKTATRVTRSDAVLRFDLTDGTIIEFYHDQDCCENVYIEDIIGDLSDLENSELLEAEENSENDPDASESGTWTFYRFGTQKGSVVVRFYGSSNGYYGEGVSTHVVRP